MNKNASFDYIQNVIKENKTEEDAKFLTLQILFIEIFFYDLFNKNVCDAVYSDPKIYFASNL